MSRFEDDRPTVKLGSWEPPEQYNQPILEPQTSTRTQEHDVLNGKTVIQKLGEEPETYTLRGDAFNKDIKVLRELSGDIVHLRHPVSTTTVLIEGVDANSTGAWEIENNEDLPDAWEDSDFPRREIELETLQEVEGYVRWVYNYTVELTEVD